MQLMALDLVGKRVELLRKSAFYKAIGRHASPTHPGVTGSRCAMCPNMRASYLHLASYVDGF